MAWDWESQGQPQLLYAAHMDMTEYNCAPTLLLSPPRCINGRCLAWFQLYADNARYIDNDVINEALTLWFQLDAHGGMGTAGRAAASGQELHWRVWYGAAADWPAFWGRGHLWVHGQQQCWPRHLRNRAQHWVSVYIWYYIYIYIYIYIHI